MSALLTTPRNQVSSMTIANKPSERSFRSPAISRWAMPALALALLLAIAVVYGRSIHYGFTRMDEEAQLLTNPLVHSLAPANLARMFSRLSTHSYYPMRLLCFALEHQLWGRDPVGYHITNILLHGLNTLLLMWLILRMLALHGPGLQGNRAGRPRQRRTAIMPLLAGGLFALHPVVVEPVVWIGGREELLMLLFGLGGLHAHTTARQRRSMPGSRRIRVAAWHALATLLALASALSNVAGIVFPLMVLAYDLLAVRLRRWRPIVAPNALMWVGAMALFVVKRTTHHANVPPALAGFDDLSFDRHVFVILHVLAQQVKALVWPEDLHIFYVNFVPASFVHPSVLIGLALLAAAVGLIGRTWVKRRRAPLPLLGIVWVVLAYAPYAQALPHHIHRADRFMYAPLAMLAAALGFGAAHRIARWSGRRRAALALAILAVLGLLGGLSHKQVRIWRSDLTLFQHAVDVAPNSTLALNNLGLALMRRNHFAQGQACFQRALRIDPALPGTWYNLAQALLAQGRLNAAIPHMKRSLRLEPGALDRLDHLADVLHRLGRTTQTLAFLDSVEPFNLDQPDFHAIRGTTQARLGRRAQAVTAFRRALELNPDHLAAHYALGRLLLQQSLATSENHLAQSIRHFRQVLRHRPRHAAAHYYLSRALLAKGERREAAHHARLAGRLDPKYRRRVGP